MRIGYDARNLLTPQRTGIGQYAFCLIKSISAIAPEHRLELFLPGRKAPAGLSSDSMKFVNSIVPPDIREDRFLRIWFDCYLPLRIVLDRIDIFHGPSYLIPRSCRAKTVVTVHDLTHERFPRLAPDCSPEFARRARESVVRADAVITDSRRTRDDVIEFYGVDGKKVKVIYLGVERCFFPVRDKVVLASFRERHGLPRRFVLSIVALHPRKNIPRLLSAFSLLKEKTQVPHSLVVTGKRYGEPDLRRTAEEAGLADGLLFLDYFPREELPLLYSLAEAFVFPSLYEGFGLPPLEAMACGTPVVASRAGSLPEVLGEAALYFDPEDPEEMADQIEVLLSSESERNRMSEMGLARAERFSWEKCARETLEIYNALWA